MENILDENSEKESYLQDALTWWEKRRLYYNLVVGSSGCLFVFTFGLLDLMPPMLLVIGIVFYGLVANACYCSGFLLEAMLPYYLGERWSVKNLRWFLWGAGLATSVGLNYMLASFFRMQFLPIPQPDDFTFFQF